MQGEPWLDSKGDVIDAHGGGMLEDAGTFYWYGSARRFCAKDQAGNRSICGDRDGGINLYSSTDLYSWDFVSTVVKAFNGSATDNVTPFCVIVYFFIIYDGIVQLLYTPDINGRCL